ncbi:unnamed protein product [Camellia sinensis]
MTFYLTACSVGSTLMSLITRHLHLSLFRFHACQDLPQPSKQEGKSFTIAENLTFWASKEVYDHVTIHALENEMIGGPPTNFFPKELSTASIDPSTAGLPQLATNHNALQWQLDKQGSVPILTNKDYLDKLVPSIPTMPSSLATQPFLPNSVPTGPFTGSIPIQSSLLPANQQTAPHLLPPLTGNIGEKLPPYPLFPPGLIPGMVRKMQIGSGVPYSPMSPLDIPTIIPHSNVSPSGILNSVSKFFKEIGEVNRSEGPMNGSDSKDDDDEYERDSPVRKGGACIPPPPNLQVDPETGTYADGSVEGKPGSSSFGRLGLGATPNPNEASQYDDVYSSYRKQRSSNYHTSMSARAATAR